MKHKLSITLEEATVLRIFDHMRTGKFRNKSHLVEYAVNSFLSAKDMEGQR